MQPVADTGLLKALLDRNDPYHPWAVEVFPANSPWITCEAVLTEAAHLSRAPQKVMQLVARGDLQVRFVVQAESERVLQLLNKYQDRGTDLADACLVRMTEIEPSAIVFTIDRADFMVYRRNNNEAVPCDFPPTEV